MKMNMQPQQQMQMRQRTLRRVAIGSGISMITIAAIFFTIKFFNAQKATAAVVCGNEVTGTETISSAFSCKNDLVVNGGTLYIEAAVTLKDKKLEIKNNGKVIIRNGGSLSAKELKVDRGELTMSGNVELSKKMETQNYAKVTLSAGYTLTIDEELKIESDSDVSFAGNITVKKKFEIKDSEVDVAGSFTFTGGEESKLKDGASFTILNHGTVTFSGSGKFKQESDRTAFTINPGGWLFLSECEVKKGTFVNNGYVEQTSTKKNLKFKDVDMTGNGVFYCVKKSKIKTDGGAKIFGWSKNDFSDDYFKVGSTTISVKRLPKFKVEEDGLILGDTLVVIDTLDLNGKNIDIKSHDFKLPKSFSFNRFGNNSEYIKTSSTGKYKMKILSNNKEHVAPIGRNPYLPIASSCTDCEGTEFAVAVTQNVYLNPVTQSSVQTSNAVGETWSVIPDQSFSGSITFTLQWNAGGGGTTNSELTGFTRFEATSYYWISGTSTQWTNDGTNVKVAASGSDPYSIDITLTGMTSGTEYFFSVGGSGTALPVEFSYFTAKYERDAVNLNWETATELNNDFFEVQHSTDGLDWESLETIDGAGTSITANTYESVDFYPSEGINYYRIKQVDYDGTTDYSIVQEVHIGSVNSSTIEIQSVYPNPFSNRLSLNCTLPQGGDVVVDLLDLSGFTVKSERFNLFEGSNSLQLEGLDNLSTGYYILRLSANGNQASQKVLKQ